MSVNSDEKQISGSALEVEGLNVRYRTDPPTDAVSDVFFALEPGRALSIVGESGSGKSTVVRAIGGLLAGRADVSWQRLQVNGAQVVPERMRAAEHVAYVFQEPKAYLNPSLKLGRQLIEVLRLRLGLSRADAADRAIDLLGLVGIPDPETRQAQYIHQLSGGLAQRFAIAMAIASEPTILVADEPTSALDVTIAAKVIGLIRSLQVERDMALIHVTHNLHLAAKTADRILVMYAGQVVEEGPAREVLEAPLMPYTKALLAAAPTADGRGGLIPIRGGAPDLRFPPSGCRFMARCDFATPACSQAVPLTEVSPTRSVRCIRVHELNGTETSEGSDV